VKKLLVRLLLVLAGVAGLTIPAKAQALVEVQIPFQFVVAGQTFPAGEYKITRLSDVQSRILLLSGIENGAAVAVLAIDAQSTPHNKTKLAFASVGDQHFLSRIETASHTYTLSMSSSPVLLAATPRKGATASYSSGSN
jgi:hypothetical protein